MPSSFFRDMLDQIVDRSRALTTFSLRGEDHGDTIGGSPADRYLSRAGYLVSHS